ncbi:DUF2073 domain-containing protein [archaeon SCG-AAA382B04]|nr:DUF2073 domain-containing protein [archaeon SCG-AAA382B04]
MEGIQLTLVSDNRISSFGKTEKINFILKHIKEGEIVILESGLEPKEQAKLIQTTMNEIDHDEFNGIEIETYPEKDENPSFLDRLLGKTHKNRLTVIGPADKLKTIKRNKDMIEAFVSFKE